MRFHRDLLPLVRDHTARLDFGHCVAGADRASGSLVSKPAERSISLTSAWLAVRAVVAGIPQVTPGVACQVP